MLNKFGSALSGGKKVYTDSDKLRNNATEDGNSADEDEDEQVMRDSTEQIDNPRALINTPLEEGKLMRCMVLRHKGIWSLHLRDDSGHNYLGAYLASAEKKALKGSFSIGLSKKIFWKTHHGYLGKMKALGGGYSLRAPDGRSLAELEMIAVQHGTGRSLELLEMRKVSLIPDDEHGGVFLDALPEISQDGTRTLDCFGKVPVPSKKNFRLDRSGKPDPRPPHTVPPAPTARLHMCMDVCAPSQ